MCGEPKLFLASELISELRAPYIPPPQPTFRAEALFYLSLGGRNCLDGPLSLLRAWSAVLKDKGLLKRRGIVIDNSRGIDRSREQPMSKHLTTLAPFLYFSGFGALREYLWHARRLAFGDNFVCMGLNDTHYLDNIWMDGFSRHTRYQQNAGLVGLLLHDLECLVGKATYYFTINEFWALLLTYLGRAALENERKYADLLSREVNSSSARRKLLQTLKREGIYKTIPTHQMSEDEYEAASKKLYEPHLRWLEKALSSTKIVTIGQVYKEAFDRGYAAAQRQGTAELLRWEHTVQISGAAPIARGTDILDPTSPIVNLQERSVKVTPPEQDNATKHSSVAQNTNGMEWTPVSFATQSVENSTTLSVPLPAPAAGDTRVICIALPKDNYSQENKAETSSNYNGNELDAVDPVGSQENGKHRNRTLLLKVALRYIGKEHSPIADEIRCPTKITKKIPKLFLKPLEAMRSPTITRAKKDMEGDGYKFVSGYKLEPQSFARLEEEVDANIMRFKGFIKTETKRKARKAQQPGK